MLILLKLKWNGIFVEIAAVLCIGHLGPDVISSLLGHIFCQLQPCENLSQPGARCLNLCTDGENCRCQDLVINNQSQHNADTWDQGDYVVNTNTRNQGHKVMIADTRDQGD